MTNVEILAGFEREINMLDNTAKKPVTEDSLFWLNQAVAKFTKTRLNGDLAHKTGFEQTEKRRNDLINLLCMDSIDPHFSYSEADYDVYDVTYSPNVLYVLSENVTIMDKDGDHETNTSVFECTQDSFMYRITNSLTDFHYRHHKARPLRIREQHGCKLLTDKQYKVKDYLLGYIRKPNEITLDGQPTEYTDFETETMYEIIKIAAQMFIENQKNERYQTISNEVLTQE